ncbi:MAG: DVU0298 family protein [Bacillota bacterium]
MSIKEETIGLVKKRQFDQLVLHVKNNKKAFKYLYSVLYDTSSIVRWYGIEAFGILAKELADRENNLFREIIRRFLWMMNEEGGNVNWSAPQAIGEIIYNQPKLYGDMAPMMITASLDEKIFQKGMLWAVGRFGAILPVEVSKFKDEILEFLSDEDPEIRGLTARIAGICCFKESLSRLLSMKKDASSLEIYIEGEMVKYTVGSIVEEAILRIKKCNDELMSNL